MDTLIDYLKNSDNVVVYIDGKESPINSSDFQQQLDVLCDKAYFSPSLAIAKNNEVYTNIRHGIWLEFRYNTPQEYADMDFDKLLIQIKPSMYGFNIIRGKGEDYEGRCYYLNLNNDTTKFYKFLKSMS